MNTYKHSTDKCLSELPFIFCGPSGDVEVYEDTNPKLIEHLLAICKICNKKLRIIKRETICHVCNKPLTRNGCKSDYINNTDELRLQKYNHRNCDNSSCMASAKSIKEKNCTYTKSVQEKSVLINLVNYESYEKKSEEIANQMGAKPHRSTLFYYHKKYSTELFEYLEHLQFKRIKELDIKASGIYCFDEQYVFVNKKLYLRLTLIDYHNKLIMGDLLVCEEDYNNQTIQEFLEESLKDQPVEVIVTDGRKGYKSIIEAVGAIQHRCFFHIMQNLMTPLTKYINRKNRRIKTLKGKIKDNKEKIANIKAVKKIYTGRTPYSDKKTIRQEKRIKKYENKIKDYKKEIKEIEKELKEIDKEKERVHKIWESKTFKQAKRRYNTIHNQKDQLNPIIASFLDRIESKLDVMLNHLENESIPATNNTVENYYRTTLPRCQKRIYRTLEGLKRRIREQQIRWTHRNILNQNTPLNYQTTYN